MIDIELFWSYVDKKGEDECWEWKGLTNTFGFPEFIIDGKIFSAVRIMFYIHYGSITRIHNILHHCQTSNCMNPLHFVQRIRLTEREKEQIISLRKEGYSLRKIAAIVGQSYSIVQKCVTYYNEELLREKE